MRAEEVKQQAQGRWPGICASLGIDVGDGKHTYCPICHSQKKWFRFDDKQGDGTFICNGCGAGDGLSLVQKVLGVDFKEALSEVAQLCGVVKKSAILPEKRITPEKLRMIFLGSAPITKNDTVGAYLLSRGINLFPETLRFHPKCWESETKSEMPAMLAVVVSQGGKALTMHRTYLTIYGEKAPLEKNKKLLPAIEPLSGSAIRLFEPAEGTIGIAEGIETALACYEIYGVPTWAAISSTLMEKFEPPKGIKEVVVFSDNDINFAGQKAAYALANRLVIKNKLKVSVKVPSQDGTDYAD